MEGRVESAPPPPGSEETPNGPVLIGLIGFHSNLISFHLKDVLYSKFCSIESTYGKNYPVCKN